MALTEAQTQAIIGQYYQTDPTLIRRYASLTGTPGVVTGRLGTPPPPRATAAAAGAPSAAAMPTDLWGWAQEQTNLGQQLLQRQQQQQQSLFGQYTAASQAQEPLQAAYGRLGTEAGVPELEKTIGGFKTNIADVQNRLNQLESNINERIKGQDVSEAQRQRIIGYEEAPLTKQLGELGTAMAPYTEQLSGAQSKIATQLGLISADQQKALQPLIMQIDSLSNRFSREITMYTSQKETTLTAIMDKLTRDRQLADQEWQQAQQLATEEREWARTKEQIAMEQANKIQLLGVEASYRAPSESQTKTTATYNLRDDIAKGIQGILQGGSRPWATESLISQLAAAYPEFSYEDIQNEVYAFRKPLESQYKF